MVCAVTCKFFVDLLGLLKDEAAGFHTTAFQAGQMSSEVVAFAVLGAICGLLGSAFVYLLTKVRRFSSPCHICIPGAKDGCEFARSGGYHIVFLPSVFVRNTETFHLVL